MEIPMLRLAATLVALLLAVTTAVSAPLVLHRGVGLHQWLNWSPLATDGSYRWPPYRTVEEWLANDRPASDWPAGDPFVPIKDLGFDFVRLTVDPGPLYATDGERRQEALGVLSAAVKRLTDVGLNVVFNLHGVDQVPQYGMDVVNAAANSESVARYVAMNADVARMLVPFGADRVAFEPFNEPAHYPCDVTGTEDWQQIMAASVAAVRAISADMTIVATGACGGDVEGLIDIRPEFDDPNILYSFHMYEPHLFTHQRPDEGFQFASGLPWPASTGTPEAAIEALRAHMDVAGLSAAEQQRNIDAVREAVASYFSEGWGEAQLEMRIGQAVAWAEANGIPTQRLFMGEFGVILMPPDGHMGAFNSDRLRYITAVREQAERHGIPWAIWEYSNPYGMSVIKSVGPALPDEGLLEALGL